MKIKREGSVKPPASLPFSGNILRCKELDIQIFTTFAVRSK
jgi:hypothetical protein